MSEQKYDFSKVPQAQIEDLLQFLIDREFDCQGRVSRLQEIAKVPQEKKADVARELAELCDEAFNPKFAGTPYGVMNPHTADMFRALVARYRKAVDE
jgi:hypothetical protein